MGNFKKMSLVEHLGELRRRLIWVLIVFVLTMVVGLSVAKPIILYLRDASPASGMEWNVFSPWDTIRIYLNVSMIVALVISLPYTLYHAWAFMVPGLKEHEKKATLMYIPFAFFLYLAGLAFGYFVVFPFAFQFTMMLSSSLELTETYGIAHYFSFMFNLLLPLGLLFELPVVVLFLTRIGILSPGRLVKARRYAYLLLVVVGTLFTPPDAISAMIVAFPMILLYELSVLLSRWMHRRQQIS